MDHAYSPEQAFRILNDENQLKSASLETVRSLLTWCLRGEHFMEGHWGLVIKQAYFRSLFDRLQALAQDL